MNEIETLLGMELPEDAKKLLNTVKDGYGKLNEANSEMIKTIEAKERANTEAFNDRKSLREQIKELESGKSKDNDKSTQEKLDALNKEWSDKLQTVVGERDAIKTDMLNKTKFDDFNSLNVASLLPSDWDKAKVDTAMNAIKTLVLDGLVHDGSAWVYKSNDVTTINVGTGKPMTLSDKFDEVKSSGAIDMFLASGSNSGANVPPQGGNANVTKKFADYTGAELASIRANNPSEYEALKQTR